MTKTNRQTDDKG